jgi:hypothetical protein
LYYDAKSPASFTSPEKLYQIVKRQGKYGISRNKIKKWLQEQDVYTLHRQIKRKFTRRKIITSGVDVQWAADLASVANTAKYNDGMNYLLMVICVFSKYLFVEPLRSKRAKDVLEAFERILQQGRKPQIVYTDKGGEFNNRLFKSYLQKMGIKYFTSQNEDTKVSPVERVIRTFRNKMHKLFQNTRSYRYLEQLQSLKNSYNLTPHTSLPKHMSPSEINRENEAVVWDYMYNKNNSSNKIHEQSSTKLEFKYNKGDLVRLAYTKYTFQRDYNQKWTSEVFKISERFIKQGIPAYKVADFSNDVLVGTFYGQELQKVYKNQDALWIIEKVLRKRKRGGVHEYLVKYEGWPNKFNSWVRKEDIHNING